jgi:molybdopterin-guanine dinucleotide biosynthesis protein A
MSAPSPTPRDCTLVVLAGGAGSRMGRAKHEMTLGGRPVLERILARAAWEGPTMLVLGHAGDPGRTGALFGRVVRDPVGGQGPLRGIATALHALHTEAALFLPVDMPNLSNARLRWLALAASHRPDAQAVFLRRAELAGDPVEPFPCVLRGAALERVLQCLAHGERSVRGLAQQLWAALLEAPSDWPPEVWLNLNTPQDLARFEHAPSSP